MEHVDTTTEPDSCPPLASPGRVPVPRDVPAARRASRRLVLRGAAGAAAVTLASLLAACGGTSASAGASTASSSAGTGTTAARTAASASATSSAATTVASASTAATTVSTAAAATAAATSSASSPTLVGRAGAAVTLRVIHWNAGDQRKVYDDRLDQAAQVQGIALERDWADNSSFNNKVITAIAGGLPYDVMWTDSSHIVALVVASALVELSPLLARDKVDLAGLVRGPATLNEYRFGPRVYAVPDVTFAYLMFYNLDLLNTAQVQPLGDQATWDDALQLFQKVTKRQGDTVTVYGHDNNYGAGTRYMPLMWQFGGGLWRDPDKKTTLGLDLPGTEASMQFLGDLAAKYKVMPAVTPPNISFDKGNVAASYNASYAIVGSDQRWKFQWTAAFAPRQPQHITCTITNGWNMAATGKHQDDAWQLIRYLTGNDSQNTLVQNNLLSVYAALNEAKAYTSAPQQVRQAIFASTTASRGLEDLAHPVMPDWVNDFTKGRADLLAGKTDAKTLFDEWQRRYQPQVASYAKLYA